MSLKLNSNEARQADNHTSVIRTTGKYVGVITRAEKLLSKKNTEGLGISFKSDDGATANYLDLYTVNADGDVLPSNSTAQAILCCTRVKEANEAEIEVEKWDSEAKQTYKAKVIGYPSLVGKRVGFLLQQELSTNTMTGKDVDRVVIYGVFEADTELTASEILDKKTQPEKLEKIVQSLMARPVNDRRTNKSNPVAASAGGVDNFEDDIPF